MDTIVLIQRALQCDIFEEERHEYEIILLRELRKYSLISLSIFSPKIEGSSHPSEENWYFFGLYSFDNCPNILIYVFSRLSLESVIGSYAEDHETWSCTFEYPVDTREESCGRISRYSSIYGFIIVRFFSQHHFELARI